MVILSFLSSFNYYDKNKDKYSQIYNTQNAVEAVVIAVKYESSYSSSYEISVKKLNGKEETHKAILECDYSGALNIGDEIAVLATATEPSDTGGRYSERNDALSNGFFVIYTSEEENDLRITDYSENTIEIWFSVLNENLSNRLTRAVKGEQGNLSSALLLGNKSLLSSDIDRDFRRVGASHILALSGMHMSIIMGVAMMILKRVIRNRKIVVVLLSLMAVFYLALTGFSVSATRSVIMLLMVYIGFLVSGDPDSLTSLSLAGFLIVLLSPGAVCDGGFWMSFAATFGILAFTPALKDYFDHRLEKYDDKLQFKIHKFFYSIPEAIFASLAALIPLIIVMCIFIKQISVFTILSSLVLSIPTAIIIIASLFLLPLAGVPYISTAIVWVIRTSADLMLGYCAYFSNYEDIVKSLNYPFAILMAVLLGITLLYSLVTRFFNPFKSLIPFVVCLLIFAGTAVVYESINSDKLKVSYINASNKSDIIVLSNEREAVICDMSNGSKTSYNLALEEIDEARATEIKAIVLTRYTNSHIATLHSVFQSQKVREVWTPYPINTDEQAMLQRLYDFAKDQYVNVYVYKQGETIKPFEHAYIEHTRSYIERSSVPIDLVGIYTGRQHLTYISPAFNESDVLEEVQYHFSKSQYIIFGSRGPNVKKLYKIDKSDKVKGVAFASEVLVGHFAEPEFSFAAYYLVPKEAEMEFYLDE